MTKDTGGQAFPSKSIRFVTADASGDMKPVYDHVPGMTLRDWFAGQALNGMISVAPFKDGVTHPQITEAAYAWADAMLAARQS